MNPGRNRLGLILVTQQSSVIESGTAQVWVAKDTKSKAMGPSEAPWYQLTAYEKTHDRSPRTPLPGLFATEIELPAAGIWNVGVTVTAGSRRFAATGAVQATSQATPAQLGSKRSGSRRRWPRRWPRSRRYAPGRRSVTCTTSHWKTPSPAASPR